MSDFYDITPPERIAKINSFYEHIYHSWYDCLDIQNPPSETKEKDFSNVS